MITFFSIPKSFEGHIGLIQENAIKSWLQIDSAEIILFGDDKGVAEFAEKKNIRNISKIKKNNRGTPLVSDAFYQIRSIATNDMIIYCNTDIIFTKSLKKFIIDIINLGYRNFIGCGQRYDLNITDKIKFNNDWDKNLLERTISKGKIHSKSGIDYFIL